MSLSIEKNINVIGEIENGDAALENKLVLNNTINSLRLVYTYKHQ